MQFENKNNTFAHQQQTGVEIYNKTKEISCFVSGVGTGGTIMGVGGYLKEKLNSKIIAIEPQESPILSQGKSGSHKIQGLSDEIIPKLYDKTLVDKIIPIKSNDAICMTQKLCLKLGMGVGISSGANFLGCVLSGLDNCSTVFADDNKKYLDSKNYYGYYLGNNYYKGTPGSNDVVAQLKIDNILDYVDNNLVFKPDEHEGKWGAIKKEELIIDKYLQEDVYITVDGIKLIVCCVAGGIASYAGQANIWHVLFSSDAQAMLDFTGKRSAPGTVPRS